MEKIPIMEEIMADAGLARAQVAPPMRGRR
jgi:hypothetical protein